MGDDRVKRGLQLSTHQAGLEFLIQASSKAALWAVPAPSLPGIELGLAAGVNASMIAANTEAKQARKRQQRLRPRY